ncbi:MAG: hypothetical protein OEN01_08565 [Candidatus Krumholzibacteria bacterium]|nr:hypothetical protein [Candidatus Krumholzibacteria bacterium]
MVQAPASLAITQITTSVAQVTKNQTTPWSIEVTVANSGEADVVLSMARDETFVAFPTAQPQPDTLGQPSGDVSLPGGGATVLTFTVATTPDFVGFGIEPFDVRVGGIELNRNASVTASSSSSIVIEQPPDPTYVVASLTPATVSKGSNVVFQVEVQEVVGSSVLVLDPGETRFILNDGVNEVRPRLSDISEDSIQAGGNTRLTFDNVLIGSSFITGSYAPTIHVEGTENGNFFSKDITASDNVAINDPGVVNIERMLVSQNRVTTSQTRDWQARMVVQNNGATPVVVNAANTGVQFDIFGIGDVTPEYTVTANHTFVIEGSDTLPAGATDTLLFVVDVTGSSSGQLTVHGVFEGQEVPSGNVVQDNTFDGGSGSMVVETLGVLEIVSITPSQPTVTEFQSSSWTAVVRVQNTGGSAIDLGLGTSQLSFTPAAGGWAYTAPTALEGGGTALDAGEVDSLFFEVTSTAGAGPYRLDASLDADELNSGRALSDDTGTSGWGNVVVQTPASLAITQITKSRGSVTNGQSTPWTVDVVVKNEGEAAATVSSLRVDSYLFFPATGDTVGPPTGDTLLEGDSTKTVTFTISPTPTFAGAGVQTFDVRLGGSENNTGDPLSAIASDGVLVDLAPSPTYVAGSLTPMSVSRGGNVIFQTQVQLAADMATVVLDTNQTRFVLSNGPTTVSPRLSALSANTITAGSSTLLVFENVQIDTAFGTGNYLPQLQLRGTENGNAFQSDIETFPDSVGIQEPQAIDIERIVVSQSRVTAGQTQAWTAHMIVRNSGPSPELVMAGTELQFSIFGVGDVTPEYAVVTDLQFLGSGSAVLAAGATDTLLFTVNVTGVTTGQLTVNGVFVGQAVQDDTFAGGFASMVVETPPVLRVTQIRTSQPTVTAGQTTDWQAIVYVENQGQAGVRLAFDAAAPQIRAVSAPGYTWVQPTALAAGGDSLLSGGETDSLIFTADSTSPQIGTQTLHALVRGLDVNSGSFQEFDTENQGSGSGSIVVQDSARVVIESTILDAPNAPTVNTNQTFGFIVRIGNQGEADLRDVSYTVSTSGGSTLQPPATRVTASIPAGSTAVDTFAVVADGVLGSETATASIVDAIDANSTQTDLVIVGPHTDPEEVFTKVAPAVLAIDQVAPSQPTVTRQQANPWMIDVAISNPGGADLDVTPPQASDISFFIGPAEQSDYIVVPPASFVSGTPGDWRVNSGASQTLQYSVTTTGSATGVVKIQANLTAADINDLAVISDEDSGSVTVQDPSGLFVASTQVDASTAPNTPFVNNQQMFNINVDVTNTGEEVDSVQVSLVSNSGGTGPINLISPVGVVRIEPDSTETFVFEVTADDVTTGEQQVIFTSSITKAISVNSGLPVTPTQPADNQEIVTVQTSADLKLTLQITNPPGATDGTVSTGQVFEVTALVTNLGSAGVETGGEVTISLPAGFSLEPTTPSATVVFTVESPMVWDVRSPGSAVADTLVATVSTVPRQLNEDAPATVSQPVDKVPVDVLDSSGFTSPDLAIVLPAGAADGTLSTEQEFFADATVVVGATTVDVTATLLPSAGLTVIGPVVQNLNDGDGKAQTARYRIVAPSLASLETIEVRFDGRDDNSGLPAAGSTQTVNLDIVQKTRLNLGAVITTPEAQDFEVSVGTQFDIQAVVTNLGAAGIDTSVAKPRIELIPAPGYTLDASTPRVQSFAVGNAVVWTVLAPSVPSGPDQLTVEIIGVPDDENTNQAAVVTNGDEDIVMLTTSSDVTVQNISVPLGIDPKVVPRGTQDVRMLAVRITNPAASADPVRIDSIDVVLRDRNGSIVANPASALTELFVEMGGQRVDANIGQSPVTLAVAAALGSGAELAPTGADTLIFSVSVSQIASLDQFSIEIRDTTSIRIRNVVSGEQVRVVDELTQQDFTGRLRSETLVILSDRFEEFAHNYPNPFSPIEGPTRIVYFLDTQSGVSVRIYDLTGALVYQHELRVGDAGTGPGPQEILWDGTNMKGESVRNGVYVCRLTVGSKSATFKIAVAK